MNDAVLRTSQIILVALGVVLLVNALLALREKKNAAWKRVVGFSALFVSFIIPAYFGGIPFLAVVMLIAAIGSAEFYSLVDKCGTRAFKTTGVIFSSLLPLMAFTARSQVFHTIIALLTLAILAMSLYRRQILRDLTIDIQSSAVTALGMLYVGWTSSYLILIRNLENGLNYLFFFYLLVCVYDVTSYYIGKFFGRTRIFSRISPGKSLEGSVGGLIAALISAYLLRYLLPGLETGQILFFAALIAVSGQVGDLVESSLKREAQVKDAGTFVPEIGGILDKFDSLIYAAPIVYVFLALLTRL